MKVYPLILCCLLPALAVEVGDLAPEVRLPDQNGQPVNLGDHYGRDYVAVYFYPKDDTAGCTMQAKSVTASYDDLLAAGLRVYGVSVQDVASKKLFCDKYDLRQPMLSDVDKTVSTAFGTVTAERALASRWTFVLDPSLTIRWLDRSVKAGEQAATLLRVVAELKAADEADSLGRLGDQTASAGGVTFALPAGWSATGEGTWSADGLPEARLTLRELASPETPVAPTEATVRRTEQVKVGGGHGTRLAWTEPATDPTRYGSAVVWTRDGRTRALLITVPFSRAAAASRLLAALVASID